jgi:hypothetical protein
MPRAALTIVYLKRGEQDSGEVWPGSLAGAKERARKAVRLKQADLVMVIGDGKIAFRYPEVGRA